MTDVDPGWAWAEYEPDGKRPWTPQLAGHLLRRATFGADWQQHQQAAEAGPRRTIDLLMRPEADVASFERTMSQDEEAVARGSSIESLRAWWLRRMIKSPHPLQEKMTLFWHSHFGVSNSRVNEAQLDVAARSDAARARARILPLVAGGSRAGSGGVGECRCRPEAPKCNPTRTSFGS